MHRAALFGLCVLQIALVVQSKLEPNDHSQFDYRAHHQQAAAAAAKAVGSSVASEPSKVETTPQREPPRYKDGLGSEDQEPERWSQYIPEKARSIAVEISEARREARELEAARLRKEKERKEEKQKQESERAAAIKAKNRNERSRVSRGVQSIKSATKKTGRKAQSKVQKLFEDDGEDDEEEYNEDNDEEHSTSSRKRSKSSKAGNFGAGVWNLIRSLFIYVYLASRWSGRHLLWTPMTYVSEAVRWSASTSWKTTRWTGERALVGPALTAGAPLIYLAEGLLFIFVWIPARVLGVIVRELYPVYIYLGAALAVGTAMGIGSALILYIGSFFFSNHSLTEESLSNRADLIPQELQQRFREKKKTSPAKKWSKKGGSIIEQAIQESLKREQREKSLGHQRASQEGLASPIAVESDEEDDYFGNATSSSFKGKARSSNDATPTGPTRRTAAHFGPPLPVGATNHGGWSNSRSDSASSSPAASPITSRAGLPNMHVFPTDRGNLGQSPLVSPDVIRSASQRQRRGLNSSM